MELNEEPKKIKNKKQLKMFKKEDYTNKQENSKAIYGEVKKTKQENFEAWKIINQHKSEKRKFNEDTKGNVKGNDLKSLLKKFIFNF